MSKTVEQEKQNRICIALWAYAYEVMHDSIVDDDKYDKVSNAIDVNVNTGNNILDRFFRDKFSPYTSLWIYEHPEAHKLPIIYSRITGKTALKINFEKKKKPKK